MKPSFLVFCSGVIFGAGLAVSGMLSPAKVAGFLDLFGVWDPSLAFVMGGGILVNFIGFRLATRYGKPLFAKGFVLPTKTDFEMPVLIGAAIFGAGWAMAGLCPGPAIASLMLNPADGVLFLFPMCVGLGAGRLLTRRLDG